MLHCRPLRRSHNVNAGGLFSSGIPGGRPPHSGRRRQSSREFNRSASRSGTLTWSPRPGSNRSYRANGRSVLRELREHQASEVPSRRPGHTFLLHVSSLPSGLTEISLPHPARSRAALHACSLPHTLYWVRRGSKAHKLSQGCPLTTKDAASATAALLPVWVAVHSASALPKRWPEPHSSDTENSLPSGLIVGGFASYVKPAAPHLTLCDAPHARPHH